MSEGTVTWTLEWPKEEGRFWFYGYRSKDRGDAYPGDRLRPPDLRVCVVHHAGSEPHKFWMYVLDGAFLYKEEGAVAYWLKMEVPDLPTLPVPEVSK